MSAAAAHPASGDILLLTDPSDKEPGTTSKPVSVALLPGGSEVGSSFESLAAIDTGSAVTYPVDLAFLGDTALVLDQGEVGVAAFNRTSSGAWSLWKKWHFSQLLPKCDAKARSFGLPESIAVGPSGEVYVSVGVTYGKRCLFHPLDLCCTRVGTSSGVMRLEISQGEASLHEVFMADMFYKYSFHIKAMDVAHNGDIVVAGFGDEGMYFAHSVWRWEKQTQQAHRIAGRDCCRGNHSGDGGDATQATLDLPWGLVLDGRKVYISEAGNKDVRVVVNGVVSTVESAPHGDHYENNYFRKLHLGAKPGTLLLAVSGMGTDDGRLVEFDIGQADSTLVV